MGMLGPEIRGEQGRACGMVSAPRWAVAVVSKTGERNRGMHVTVLPWRLLQGGSGWAREETDTRGRQEQTRRLTCGNKWQVGSNWQWEDEADVRGRCREWGTADRWALPEIGFVFGIWFQTELKLFCSKGYLTKLKKIRIKYWAIEFEVKRNFNYCNFSNSNYISGKQKCCWNL
jgi:hypothetical protein